MKLFNADLTEAYTRLPSPGEMKILADIFLTLLSLFAADELWLRGYQEFDPSRGERGGKSFLSPPKKWFSGLVDRCVKIRGQFFYK